MAAINLQLARARYQGRLTEDWIMVDIPNWLKHVDDHVVFPSYDLTVNGSKWIKFSSYGHFVGALESYWKQKNPVELQHPKLRVVVMSYTPVAEAHQLHQLLSNPDLLPSSYTEVIGTPSVVSLGPMQMQGGEEDEEEEEEDILNEERDGILYLAALGVNVQFTITNYSVLWAKSERFCMNTFMSEAFEDVLSRLVLCEQHLHQPTAATLVNLRANLMHAKRHLIFAMYLNGE